jgi:hypothetical protein
MQPHLEDDGSKCIGQPIKGTVGTAVIAAIFLLFPTVVVGLGIFVVNGYLGPSYAFAWMIGGVLVSLVLRSALRPWLAEKLSRLETGDGQRPHRAG